MKDFGPSKRRAPDETYLGDVEGAQKIADARRAARSHKPSADQSQVSQVANLRQQIVALLESADMQELLTWAHDGPRVPWAVRRKAYQVEARRKIILNRLKAGGS